MTPPRIVPAVAGLPMPPKMPPIISPTFSSSAPAAASPERTIISPMSFSTSPMSPSSHASPMPVSSIIVPTLFTASCIVGRNITPALGIQSGKDIPGIYGTITSKRPSRYSVTGFPSASNTGLPSSSTTGTLSPKTLPPVFFILSKSPVTPPPPVITSGPLDPAGVTGGAAPAKDIPPCSINNLVSSPGSSISASSSGLSTIVLTISCALSKASVTY